MVTELALTERRRNPFLSQIDPPDARLELSECIKELALALRTQSCHELTLCGVHPPEIGNDALRRAWGHLDQSHPAIIGVRPEAHQAFERSGCTVRRMC